MQALVWVEPGRVDIVDVPRPVPGPDEVLVAVTAAGVCQTDVHIRRHGDRRTPPGTILGHEVSGTAVELGSNVRGWETGRPVAVYPVWSCGSCRSCLDGRRNGCLGTGGRLTTPRTPGVSVHGGMAEFVVVPAAALADIGDLDPAVAATMSDAALSPYGSIRAVHADLHPGTVAVVIGVGGLGNMAVQILRSTTATVVVAVDVSAAALASAEPFADHVLSADAPDIASTILELSGGYGVQAVFDFVGVDSSLALAADVVAPFGTIRVTGMGGGSLTLGTGSASRLPRGATIASRLYSGTYAEFLEVLSLARRGALTPELTHFEFGEAVAALDALEAGEIRGRAVVSIGPRRPGS